MRLLLFRGRSAISKTTVKRNVLNLTSNFLKYLLLATSALYILSYIVIALLRIRYPFELEWLEGGVLEHVRRILEGKKLFVAPSIEFVTFIYTPLHYYVSALAAKITGLSFFPLRLVSLLSSLGSFFIIYLIVKKETQSRFAGVVATGLFAATFRLSAFWFDIGRADSLFIFLLLVTIYLIRFEISIISYVLAGVLVSLSFLTKQTALVISLPIMLYAILSNWRRSIFFVGTAIALIFGSTVFFDRISDGWFIYYIYKLPSYHAITKSMILGFWTKDIFPKLAIAFVASLLYIFALLAKPDKKALLFYLLVGAGMVGGAWFTRLNWASYPNVLMPAHAMIAILFGLATHKISEGLLLEKQVSIKICIYLICLIQFALLIYNPFRQVPPRADMEAGKQLVNTIAQYDGNVFIPSHGYLAAMAGKNSYAHAMVLIDLLIHDKGPIGKKLFHEIRQAINEQKFSAIILDNKKFFQYDTDKFYKKSGPVFQDKNVFWPVTGARNRPEFIYVPKE